MSSNVTVRVTDVVVRSAAADVVVRSTGPAIVAAGGSGPAGPVWAGKFGSFYSSATQTPATVNVAQPVTFNGTYTASGISVASSSRITLATVGTYTLTFVGQLSNSVNDVETATFWIRLNGNDYPYSATRVSMHARKNESTPFTQLVTITFVGTSLAPGDYVEIVWSATSTGLTLDYDPATVSPPVPLVPSAIVGITQVA